MRFPNQFLVFFLLLINITFSQEWIKTSIKDFASIEFPVESELIENDSETTYSASDTSAYYALSIRELTGEQVFDLNEKDIPVLYQGVVRGTMNAADGQVVAANDILIQGLPAFEIEYTVKNNVNLPSQRFKRILYFNQHIVTIDFWPLRKLDKAKKAKYFNSLIIYTDKKDEQLTRATVLNDNVLEDDTNDNRAYETGYKIGYFIGSLAIYLLLALAIVGLFFLIRYLVREKEKSKKTRKLKTHITHKPSSIECSNCGAENNFDSKYCKKCGFQLEK